MTILIAALTFGADLERVLGFYLTFFNTASQDYFFNFSKNIAWILRKC